MITSNHIIKLSEGFLKSEKILGQVITVYENPTSSDFVSLSKQAKEDGTKLDAIRYIANSKDQKIFVVNAEFAIHQDIRMMLKYPLDQLAVPYLLNGEATLQSGRLVCRPNVSIVTKSILYVKNHPNDSKVVATYLKDVFSYNWNWLDRYVAGIVSEITTAKKEFEQLIKRI